MLVKNYSQILKGTYSLIDLRSNKEYIKGSLPHSVNIPILDDSEREKVGIEYVKFGKKAAINMGENLVSESKKEKRVDLWINHLKEFPNSIFYCMRGGLRSQIAQSWLKEKGVEIPIVIGGYKKLRSECINIHNSIKKLNQNWIIIGGKTGSGKTNLIEKISNSIDLEKIANHRGSAFGAKNSFQPTTINFENNLAIELLKKDNKEYLVMEDESRSIGKRIIPEIWYQKMKESEVYILKTSLEERIFNIRKEYIENIIQRNITKEILKNSILDSLTKIKKKLGGANFNEIANIIYKSFLNDNLDNHNQWIEKLLTLYYDPMYDYQLLKKKDRVTFSGNFIEIKSKLN